MGNVSRRDAIARALALAGIGIGTVFGFAGLASPAPTKLPSNSITGSGTSPFLAKWTATQTISSSIFQDDGTGLKGTTDLIQTLGTSAVRYLTVFAPNMDSGAGQELVLKTGGGNRVNVASTVMYPSSDATLTLGLSNRRWIDLFLSRRAIIAGKNAIVVESLNETQASGTVPNTDTNLKTYSLPANTYTHVIVEAEGYVTFTTLSTNQDVNIKIKSGSTQQGNTMIVDAALSATSKIPFSIKASFVQTGSATLAITHGAAAADANTTTFLNSMRVYGET